MSSVGSEERKTGGRKFTLKYRHLSCKEYNIPLTDCYEYNRCQDSWSRSMTDQLSL